MHWRLIYTNRIGRRKSLNIIWHYWTPLIIIEHFEHYWNYKILLNSSGRGSFEERKSLIIATPRVWTDGQLDVSILTSIPWSRQSYSSLPFLPFYKKGQIECQIETNGKNVTTPWQLYVSATGTQICWHLNRINILFHISNAHQYTCTLILIIMVGVTFWLSILTTIR